MMTKEERERFKEELGLIQKEQPNKELVESLLDSTKQMANDIAEKEAEIAIRLYLLRAVIDNITLRQAFVKYKVQTSATSDMPREYTDGYPTLIKKIKDHQLYNTYESYVKLVPREPVDELSIDWIGIESDFVDFLTKGLEI